MHRNPPRLALLALLTTAAAAPLLTGCGPAGPDRSSLTASREESSAAVGTGGSSAASSQPSQPSQPTPSSPSSPSSQTTGPSTPPTSAPRPEQVTPGSSPVWALYVAVAPVGDDDGLGGAADRVADLGYAPVTGALCEVEAYAPLGLDPATQYDAVTVFFGNEADAEVVADQLAEPSPAGVVQVLVSACADGM